jgi:cyclophilin family peptidyl-prolyl cis-trans isomerase
MIVGMRVHSAFVIVLLLLPVLLAGPARGQAGEPDAEPAVAETADLAPAEVVDPLLRTFDRLRQSVTNAGGIFERDLDLLRGLRDRVGVALTDHPEDPRLLALETQLSIWLKDDERVESGFRRLIEATGDASAHGLSWIGYFRGTEPERLDGIYEYLMQRDPEDASLRLNWADHLKFDQRYAQALEVLTGGEPPEDGTVRYRVVLAECQLALDQYDEAMETLDSITPEELNGNPAYRVQVTSLKGRASTIQASWAAEHELRAAEAEADDLPRVEMNTARGRIELELFDKQAPNTVANFISLIDEDFYEGTTFHQVQPGVLVEGGDAFSRAGSAGTPGTGQPGYRIPDEHREDGARRHFAGSIGMTRGASIDSAGCRFYITLKPTPERDKTSTVFGRVVDGMDVLRSIEEGDLLETMSVLRRRDHEYEPQTFPLRETLTPPSPPQPEPTIGIPTPGG